MSITYWKTPITSLTTSKNNIIITDNSFDPRFYSLSLYMLVSTLVTYYSNMSTSSSTTYLSATIPTTSTTSPTSLLLTLSSAQPPATSSNCTFYTLKMLLMTILASILVTLSATMGTSNSSCGISWTLWTMYEVYQCQNNWKKLGSYPYFNILHFLPVAHFRPKKVVNSWVSGGCLWVSGWCLGGSIRIMDVAHEVIMPKQVLKVQKVWQYSATAFSPSGLVGAQNA